MKYPPANRNLSINLTHDTVLIKDTDLNNLDFSTSLQENMISSKTANT